MRTLSLRLGSAALAATAFLAGCGGMPTPGVQRQLMLVANDEKQSWTDAGAVVLAPHGRDSLQVLDIGTDPLAPKVVGTLALDNTIAGPPTNLAITADERLALVANSLNVVEENGVRKQVPDNRLFVIDLAATPPKLIDTLTIGRQPSGLSINKAGTLALVANRADNAVSVLRIAGQKVTLIDTVAMGESVAHVRFTPDGRRALAAKFPSHKIALLDVDGEKVTYNKVDLAAGLWPYNVDVTPDGKLALTADNGNSGASDGQVDTVSVIDLEATPPRVIDKVVVGDGPEGLAVSPTGKLAVAVILRGSNSSKSAYFYNRNGSVVALKIDGKKVTRSNEVVVRGLPEGAVFSADGKYLYVGNFIDQDITILRVDGDTIVHTGKSFGLAGHPAAMRGRVTH
ncbi:YncE family protein [Variovorax guangxiensis]|uniref:YncE family protein n=1 Tax=Variovorax guangxiensis TaxID=1775474 RepID=A0A502DLI9_9BURK|nr:YncE family protein [Variovorax guangxiensis]TPG21290.1 YncE family protein [Variovorax ginsengisoli]TPG25339.1 YncE family protein [Variovorax guangxiensis]